MRTISHLLFLAATLAAAPAHAQLAKGIVYEDRNANLLFDKGDEPLKGIRVSNGVEIVKTDKDGAYSLPVTDDTTIFVIKPRGFRTPFDEHMLPKFYYTHKPNGSPKSRYRGVAPTGPLPESVDFALYPQKEPDTFRAIMWADPQPRDLAEIEYVTHDAIEELIGVEASFGVTLGDIMFNQINLFDEQNARIALIGIPWYNVIGNHDLNMDAKTDKHSDETFERVFGPNYYSFDYGQVHFIALDDVNWFVPENDTKGKYTGGIDKDQLQFVKNDLAEVPKDKLLVLMMHIPLTGGGFNDANRAKLLALFDDRPHTMSISGHTHYQRHEFLGPKDGWNGKKPHHHAINVTVSGSWWGGAPDEEGIPHTTMRDGAPNGYSIMTFDGTDYKIEFKAARRPASHQMTIFAPEEIPAAVSATTEVIVNVFAGSRKSTVDMKVDNGDWMKMTRYDGMDPYFAQMKQSEKTKNPPNGRKLPDQDPTNHLWKANLPAGVQPGTRTIYIRTTDMFGQTYHDARVIVVR